MIYYRIERSQYYSYPPASPTNKMIYYRIERLIIWSMRLKYYLGWMIYYRIESVLSTLDIEPQQHQQG